jgi:hypothetical protein
MFSPEILCPFKAGSHFTFKHILWHVYTRPRHIPHFVFQLKTIAQGYVKYSVCCSIFTWNSSPEDFHLIEHLATNAKFFFLSYITPVIFILSSYKPVLFILWIVATLAWNGNDYLNMIPTSLLSYIYCIYTRVPHRLEDYILWQLATIYLDRSFSPLEDVCFRIYRDQLILIADISHLNVALIFTRYDCYLHMVTLTHMNFLYLLYTLYLSTYQPVPPTLCNWYHYL